MPCGGRANQRHFSRRVVVADGVPPLLHLLCLDPQTSGGLVLAVEPAAAGQVLERLADGGVTARAIGHVASRDRDGALVRIE
jgi:selenide,water dikinase